MKPFGCLITILIILVFAAAFGFTEWNTVGSMAKWIVYLVIAAVIVAVLLGLWGRISDDD